ncbi:G patch domain-containing protein 4 [Mortierella hygrophila]|uniref:G patch domain-containing protein 4 n=1 Tax=Mortierella hygrophila TaxID=979708 RepID=A0A9P6K685_9FUNG|nr:G patch domain-containing protein 4 [Mortierella hygrophila]
MSFAEKQLAKFGWKSGDGLGKNKDGIKKSISVTKKNDTKGLGGKLDKWDFAWWDHVFNKSAANIQVNKDESGEVKVEKQAPSDIQTSRMGIISTSRPAGPSLSAAVSTDTSGTSTPTTMGSMTPRDDYADDEAEPKPAVPAKSGPSWLFGFVKASASSTATEEAKRTNKDFTNSASSFAARAEGYDDLKAAEGDSYRDYSVKVSDKELFEACEGRTARKGARSEQPGKLGRVTTELLIDDGSKKSKKTTTTAAKEKKEKKEKKDKKDKKDKKEKKSKAEKKQSREKKQPKEKKDKSESKEKKEKKVKKEKKDKEEKKSMKRSAEEDEPRSSKKSKKEKSN